MALIDLPAKFNEIKTSAEQVEFSDVRLSDNFKKVFENYISENAANGYSEVEWADFSTKIITSTSKSIYLPNYWFYLASELAGYLDGLAEQRELFKKVFAGEELNSVAKELREVVSSERATAIKKFFSVNNYNDDDYSNFEKFISDYSSWGGGKTIDRDDYYVSPLMKAGNLLAETQSAVAEIAKLFFNVPLLRSAFRPIFVTSYSGSSDVHEGILSKDVLNDKSRGQFVYKLVSFLLKKNRQDPFFGCLVDKNVDHGSYNLQYNEYRLTSFFKVSDNVLNEEDLVSGDKQRFFQVPFEYKSKYYYLSNQWTDGTESRLDIQTLIPLFNALYDDYKIVTEEDEYVLKEMIIAETVRLPKSFLLLAGLSGTGKTRFVREQAQSKENYCLVSVRPDWHEPSDLLGYVSRLSGKPEYISTKVLEFIINAWKAVAPDANADGHGDLNLSSPPYWLCLDEMNLAPVEQYFADYLSVLESHKIKDGVYECEALLDGGLLNDLKNNGGSPQKNLSLDDNEKLWEYFLKFGIGIPPNLIVAGTVNMDETTHGFSRKVIDRAFTFDFGEFFPNDYSQFFESDIKPVAFTYPNLTQAKRHDLAQTFDPDGEKTIQFLEVVNGLLKSTPFELAYRALNELLLQVVCFNPQDNAELQAVWDDFLMSKVLPRIDGDEDKLTIKIDNDARNILTELAALLEQELSEIWSDTRKDFYRVKTDGSEITDINCRTRVKLEWMAGRLEVNTFTSFWP